MKVNLVVATGVHQGKVIPILGVEFLIGRDPQCQLRPASQAVSKQHCAVLVREGKVFVRDYGSTNGTFLNDTAITPNGEVEVRADDRLRVGPLDFSVQVVVPRPSDSTPLPEALKRMSPGSVEKLKLDAGSGGTPAPATRPAPETAPAAAADHDHDSKMAAMLLGMGDEESGEAVIPQGSTVMELPAVVAAEGGGAKSDEKKKTAAPENSSDAASEILRRYMRRPR
jgi:predicted component of type VI protein secretion system